MTTDGPILEQKTSAEHGNQLRFVTDVLARHWLKILLCTTAATFVGGFAGWYLHEERYEYTAVATLYVRPSLYETPIMENMGGRSYVRITPQSILERTSSRRLAEDVVRALVQQDTANAAEYARVAAEDEFERAAAEIEERLQLEAPGDTTGVLRVTAKGTTAAEAERIAELAARTLIERSRQFLFQEQREAYELVRRELDDLRRQLDDAESRQWAYREQMGFLTHEPVLQEMEEKTAELREARTMREETLARLIEIEAALEQNSLELPDALGSVSETTVARLIEELEELLGEKAELMVIWQEGSPGLQEIDQLIQDKRDAIRIAINQLHGTSGGGSGYWERRQELYRQRVDLELQLTTYDIRISTLEKLLSEMVNQLPQLAEQRFEHEKLQLETEQIRQQFNRMLEKEFELKTAQNRAAATLERRDAIAIVPAFTGRASSIWSMLVLGALLGFLAGFGWSVMDEMMDTSIRSPEDVTQFIQLEVLGMIPLMRFGKPGRRGKRRGAYVVGKDEEEIDACIVTQHDPKSPIAEAYRSLRTHFQFATIQQRPKTVMITSAVPGEGKTTTAVNFAVTMADQGLRVLVADTDLRRPNVHRVLRTERGPGLADVLRERIPVENVIRPTAVENLWALSSGRVPPNPSELIGSERMRRLVHELGGMFDLVVCDAPSIHVVTDSILLATHVDTAILVIAAEYSRRETILRAKKLLETATPFIAGVVLNGLEATRRHYYYYYYYYDDRTAPALRKWYSHF